MEKGHYGQYTGNARHSKVTDQNFDDTKRDDEKHMKYLKEDVLDDQKYGGSHTDEKHISKIAGDLKYDEKHHS